MSKKSSLPSMKETMNFAGKFMRDLKNSVSEIIDEYQKAREEPEKNKNQKSKATKKPKSAVSSTKAKKPDSEKKS